MHLICSPNRQKALDFAGGCGMAVYLTIELFKQKHVWGVKRGRVTEWEGESNDLIIIGWYYSLCWHAGRATRTHTNKARASKLSSATRIPKSSVAFRPRDRIAAFFSTLLGLAPSVCDFKKVKYYERFTSSTALLQAGSQLLVKVSFGEQITKKGVHFVPSAQF